MGEELPLVSIAFITYNHEEYIRQALDSILMQRVNFKYEIVVGEDNSKDHTREILMEYNENYPQLFKLLLRDENLGAAKNFYDTCINCSGKYIALFEGDDYWVNPYKLRKQVDFMNNNPDCSECFGLARVIDKNGIDTDIWPCRNFDAEDYSELAASFFIPTSSVVIKNYFIENDYSAYFIKGRYLFDRILHTLSLRHGKLKFINQVLSVYRFIVSKGVGNYSSQNLLRNVTEVSNVMEIVAGLVDDKYLPLAIEEWNVWKQQVDIYSKLPH